MIGLIGYGSWATAIVKLLQQSKYKTKWWVNKKNTQNFILKNGYPPKYLKDTKINLDYIVPSCSIKTTIKEAKYIVFATPSVFYEKLEKELLEHKKLLQEKKIIVSIKGLMPKNGTTVTENLIKKFNVKDKNIAVLTGPCHAEEIQMNKRAYLTSASSSQKLKKKVSEIFTTQQTKCSISNHLIDSIEFSTVLKNIYSITSGIFHSNKYGQNFRAVLVSNSAKEIQEFIRIKFNQEVDILNSAILGDLIVTAYSEYSRNFTFGTHIGKGFYAEEAIKKIGMVPEGYYAIISGIKNNIFPLKNMPILEYTYKMIVKKINLKTGLKEIEKILT